MLIRARELIADVGRDAGLDAAGAEGDQEQYDRPHVYVPTEREHDATGEIDDREYDDRPELRPEHIGDDGAEERKEICAGLEQGAPRRRLRLPELHELHEEDRKDRVDAVEAEALGE